MPIYSSHSAAPQFHVPIQHCLVLTGLCIPSYADKKVKQYKNVTFTLSVLKISLEKYALMLFVIDPAVADILLWRNKLISGAVLAGVTTIWFLLEVVEYHFVTLLCHVIMLSMLVVFIWTHVAGFIKRSPPEISHMMLSESALRSLSARINWLLWKLGHVSCGNDLQGFFLTVTSLWVLSVVGNCISYLNLLYIVILSALTIPVMYERYKKEVDYLATRGGLEVKKALKKFESSILNKIPRGVVRDRKKT